VVLTTARNDKVPLNHAIPQSLCDLAEAFILKEQDFSMIGEFRNNLDEYSVLPFRFMELYKDRIETTCHNCD
jgi:hypothetical protein